MTLEVALALVGVTLIIVRGTIFAPLQRLWPALFHCAQCTGMWVGIVACASGVASAGHGRLLDMLIIGAATSLMSLVTDAVLLKLLGEPDE